MATKLTIFSKLIAPVINLPIVYICSSYLNGYELRNFSTLLFSSLLIQALTAGSSLRFFRIIRLGGWKYLRARKAATVVFIRQLIIGALVYLFLRFFILVGPITFYRFLLEILLFSLSTPSIFYQRIYYSKINISLFKVYFASGVFSIFFALCLVFLIKSSSAVLVYFSFQVVFLGLKFRERVDFKSIYRKILFFSKNIGPFYFLEMVSALYAYIDQFAMSLVIQPEQMGGVSLVFRMIAYIVASLSVFSFVVHYNLSGSRAAQMPVRILKRAFFLSLIGSLSVFLIEFSLRYTLIDTGDVFGRGGWLAIYLWTFAQVFSAYSYSIVISHSKVFETIKKLNYLILFSIPFLVLFAYLGHIVTVLVVKSLILLLCIAIHLRFIFKYSGQERTVG